MRGRQTKDVALELRCPVCKSTAFIPADTAIPRLQQGLLICLDCGVVFAALPPYKRDWLKREILQRNTDAPSSPA